MTMLDLPEINTAELRSESSLAAHAIQVRLAGSAESFAKTDLDALLKGVHEEALRREIREVVVDMRELEFMNSSCFKAFVSWIGHDEELDPTLQYKIRILSHQAKHWQKRSLGALACFAADLIRVETS